MSGVQKRKEGAMKVGRCNRVTGATVLLIAGSSLLGVTLLFSAAFGGEPDTITETSARKLNVTLGKSVVVESPVGITRASLASRGPIDCATSSAVTPWGNSLVAPSGKVSCTFGISTAFPNPQSRKH